MIEDLPRMFWAQSTDHKKEKSRQAVGAWELAHRSINICGVLKYIRDLGKYT